MLRKNVRKTEHRTEEEEENRVGATASSCIAMVDESDEVDDGYNKELPIPEVIQKETWRDVKLDEGLSLRWKNEFSNLLERYQDVLTDIPGRTDKIEHEIVITDPTTIKIKQYKLPFNYLERIDKEISELLRLGIVGESDSEFSFPVIGVLKKDKSIRICVDFRKLNKRTINQAIQMPTAEAIFSKLTNARVFVQIDLTRGFWQIPIKKESRHLTAFSSPRHGHLEWNVTTMGLCGSSFTFTKLVTRLIKGLSNIEFYIDDILIYSDCLEELYLNFERFLDRLRQFGLTAKPSKMIVGSKEVTFLGFKVGNGRLQPANSVIEKILKIQTPTSKRQVRSILGLLNFYSKFVPRYNETAKVLQDLTRKNSPDKIIWSHEHQRAITYLQDFFNSPRFLQLPDQSRQFAIFSDASLTAIASMLSQQHEDVWLPVEFYSRKLSKQEQNWPILQCEMFSVVCSIKHFEHILLGKPFIVFTDSKCLVTITDAKMHSNKRLIRWKLLLEEFDITWIHVDGKDNVIPDFMSRNS